MKTDSGKNQVLTHNEYILEINSSEKFIINFTLVFVFSKFYISLELKNKLVNYKKINKVSKEKIPNLALLTISKNFDHSKPKFCNCVLY